MANAVTKHIPNTITCCNLLSGCLACMAAHYGLIERAFLFIVLGAVFDFCDGLSARLLHAYSPIGKELDSLADLITFGFAPALLCMHMLSQFNLPEFVPYFGLILVAFAALRLAKFNTDTRQTTSFLGLPVPANALFWCGVAVSVTEKTYSDNIYAWILIAVAVCMSLLMVSEIPMFSLKFKNLKWADNKVRFIFLAVGVILLVILKLRGASAVIGWYIILSLLTQKKA